jgi:membrane associated rhomboid family serine protease
VVVWGGALLSSLVPHAGISWQGHLSGGIAGVLAAWYLARQDGRRGRSRSASAQPVKATATR